MWLLYSLVRNDLTLGGGGDDTWNAGCVAEGFIITIVFSICVDTRDSLSMQQTCHLALCNARHTTKSAKCKGHNRTNGHNAASPSERNGEVWPSVWRKLSRKTCVKNNECCFRQTEASRVVWFGTCHSSWEQPASCCSTSQHLQEPSQRI